MGLCLMHDPTPEVRDSAQGFFSIQISSDMIRDAVLDALRLDYQGDLAKICQSAVAQATPHLNDMISVAMTALASDSDFASSLKSAIQLRIIRTAEDKVERIVKKMSFEEIQSLARNT